MDLFFTHRSTAAISVKRSALWCVLLASLVPAPAAAWCRASAEVGMNGECVKTPQAPLLFWKRTCTLYHFNVDVFDQLDALNEREVRSAFDAGFDAWAQVECNGRAPFFVEQGAGTTTTAQSEYKREGPNESVVIAIDGERWNTLPDHSERAVAMTLMWHNRKTGEILDTDIELNLGAGSFADCVAGACKAGMVDLQNTIAHEAGHVLGLGHSTDTSATMAAQTVGTVDIQKRSLGQDDIAGYCALDLPEWECSSGNCACSPPQSSGSTRTSCHVILPGTNHVTWPWSLLALVWAARRLLMERRRRA